MSNIWYIDCEACCYFRLSRRIICGWHLKWCKTHIWNKTIDHFQKTYFLGCIYLHFAFSHTRAKYILSNMILLKIPLTIILKRNNFTQINFTHIIKNVIKRILVYAVVQLCCSWSGDSKLVNDHLTKLKLPVIYKEIIWTVDRTSTSYDNRTLPNVMYQP